MVFLKTNADSTEGLIIALKCETDFVAKNEEFVKLGEAIVSKAIEVKPASIEEVKNLPIFDGRSAQDHITDLMGKIGEKIELSAYELLKADKVVSYTHLGAKLGVLLAITGTNGTDVSDMGKDIAMQIAAMKPVAIDKDDVSEELLNKELDIAKEKARNDGKPENIIDKIAQSALQSFFKENTLLNQPFVKDNSKTVAQLLQSVGKDLKITAFRRISVS